MTSHQPLSQKSQLQPWPLDTFGHVPFISLLSACHPAGLREILHATDLQLMVPNPQTSPWPLSSPGTRQLGEKDTQPLPWVSPTWWMISFIHALIHSCTHSFTHSWKEWTTDNSGNMRGPIGVFWAPKPKCFVYLCDTNHAVSFPTF